MMFESSSGACAEYDIGGARRMSTDSEFDVTVVGAGGGGMAAAVSAAEAGASVLLVEAADRVGGATALSGGSFMAAGTAAQAAAGYPDDTAEEFFEYWMTFNRWQADPAIARRFCEAAEPTLSWLTGLGVEFLPQNVYRAGLERAPRSHRPTGGGLAIVEALRAACRSQNVEIALGNRVDGLIVDDGRVKGVRSRGEDLTSDAVIVTTGGFGANPELIRQHYPDSLLGGPDVWSPAPETCVGDGLALGESVGAATTGRNRGELLLSPGFSHDLEPFVPAWLVYVNAGGRRFVNEAAPYIVIAPLAIAEGGVCWVIFDDVARKEALAPADPRWGAGSWISDVILAEVGRGRIHTGDDIAGLASAAGLPAEALQATVARYNEDYEAGRDTQFFKDASAMKPIATPPFYAVKMLPSVVAVTGYGLRIDTSARVLRAVDDRPIPGLYAAGEASGGVIGAQYVGGGNAMGSALIFGRIAGQSAVADLGR
jgi:fumarate reductase flavoprotein subunit